MEHIRGPYLFKFTVCRQYSFIHILLGMAAQPGGRPVEGVVLGTLNS
jgi:hypothetical protein